MAVFYLNDPAGEQGLRAIDVGPEMKDYRSFPPPGNFGLGYNEVKALEANQVIQSIIDNRPAWPTFADAKRIVALADWWTPAWPLSLAAVGKSEELIFDHRSV